MFRPGDFMSAKAASGYNELVELGHVPGVESPYVLAHVDPIEKDAERPSDETAKGVEVRIFPGLMLNQDPELWDIVDRFRCGVTKDLTHQEFDELSAWQIEAWLVMRGANNREELREMKRSRPDHG